MLTSYHVTNQEGLIQNDDPSGKGHCPVKFVVPSDTDRSDGFISCQNLQRNYFRC